MDRSDVLKQIERIFNEQVQQLDDATLDKIIDGKLVFSLSQSVETESGGRARAHMASIGTKKRLR
jgi:hypothetical protein